MRLYVTVSETVKLRDLSSIVEDTKASYDEFGITGVFSYNLGHYLQVIEGEDSDIENIVKNFQKDVRLTNIVEIVDLEIGERFFSDWSMNLIPLLKKNDSFIALSEYLNGLMDLLSRKQNRLFNIFYELSSDKDNAKNLSNEHKLDALVYSIEEWPDFDKTPASSSLMSLCGTLMRNPTSFRTLLRKDYCGTEAELREMLNELNNAGLLMATHGRNSERKEKIDFEEKNDNRYQKLA